MKEEKIIQFLVEKNSLSPVEDDEGQFIKNDNTIRLYWIDNINDKKVFHTYGFFGLDETWSFTDGKVDISTIDGLWFEISLIEGLELSSQCLLFTTEGI